MNDGFGEEAGGFVFFFPDIGVEEVKLQLVKETQRSKMPNTFNLTAGTVGCYQATDYGANMAALENCSGEALQGRPGCVVTLQNNNNSHQCLFGLFMLDLLNSGVEFFHLHVTK